MTLIYYNYLLLPWGFHVFIPSPHSFPTGLSDALIFHIWGNGENYFFVCHTSYEEIGESVTALQLLVSGLDSNVVVRVLVLLQWLIYGDRSNLGHLSLNWNV